MRGDGDAGCLLPGGGDRLSALLDNLLHEIMSRMKARQMVQTCVMSRRWRRLWPSVPCLAIDQEEFTAGTGYVGILEACKFEGFALNLLKSVSIAHLDTFQLHINSYYYPDDDRSVTRCIRREIKDGGSQEPGNGIQREGLDDPAGVSEGYIFPAYLWMASSPSMSEPGARPWRIWS
ncbi:hypothetical protein BAE44_0017988 [Dichanthelium oligosanthes]|uniref:F-box domain-containing protein n=1 Tax=Dichanthelium oligosanthes TaxID=888268 RepID=A0A1E5V7N0_9POAL|nr:hypothetical protein BAE44_0017988 [Dichanthelium oligosanthes]